MFKLKTVALWVATAIAFAGPGTVTAHHGWTWTEDQESQLSGTIVSISHGNPHVHLTLRNEQGLWEVDLAPPGPSARAGFVEGVAKAGDRVTLTGHRSRDPSQQAFKAETVTVNGKTYDVYPGRLKSTRAGS